jgi:hypothetical protein
VAEIHPGVFGRWIVNLEAIVIVVPSFIRRVFDNDLADTVGTDFSRLLSEVIAEPVGVGS